MNRSHRVASVRVLAIDISTRGVGFAAFESVHTLIDSGLVHLRDKSDSVLAAKINRKLDLINPEVLILEDVIQNRRRTGRAIRITEQLCALAKARKIKVVLLSPRTIRRLLVGTHRASKQDIACIVASRIPEMADGLPRARKIWMSEDPQMTVFDAAALALAFFARRAHGDLDV